MLSGRKSGEQRVGLFVCIERRIVKIVRRAASSQGVFVFGGGSRVNGSDPGLALGSCPPQKGRIALHMTYSTRHLLKFTAHSPSSPAFVRSALLQTETKSTG